MISYKRLLEIQKSRDLNRLDPGVWREILKLAIKQAQQEEACVPASQPPLEDPQEP